MSNSKIQLRLPEDLKDAAMRQAAESGISMNLFVATAIAARVGASSPPETARCASDMRAGPRRCRRTT